MGGIFQFLFWFISFHLVCPFLSWPDCEEGRTCLCLCLTFPFRDFLWPMYILKILLFFWSTNSLPPAMTGHFSLWSRLRSDCHYRSWGSEGSGENRHPLWRQQPYMRLSQDIQERGSYSFQHIGGRFCWQVRHRDIRLKILKLDWV